METPFFGRFHQACKGGKKKRMDVQIVFEPDQNRSAAYYEGQLIGECDYVVQGDQWAIVHTEVAPAFGHQGIARRLVLLVAQEAEENGYSVLPVCSYAVKVLG